VSSPLYAYVAGILFFGFCVLLGSALVGTIQLHAPLFFKKDSERFDAAYVGSRRFRWPFAAFLGFCVFWVELFFGKDLLFWDEPIVVWVGAIAFALYMALVSYFIWHAEKSDE
jgi:hypothetical protein